MKYVLTLLLIFSTQLIVSQEFRIRSFQEVLPSYSIDNNRIYSYNSFGVRSDLPIARFQKVNEYRTEVYKIDKFGVESFTPIIIEKTPSIVNPLNYGTGYQRPIHLFNLD